MKSDSDIKTVLRRVIDKEKEDIISYFRSPIKVCFDLRIKTDL
jgi:hypothetical protein